MSVPTWLIMVGRLAVAAVWVYEGLVAKIIGRRADEQAILASVPVLGQHPDALGAVIGGWELALAAMVLLGRLPRLTALAQTLTLVAFNAGGLVFAGAEIPDPAHLLVSNAAFLVLAWTVAAALRSRRRTAQTPAAHPPAAHPPAPPTPGKVVRNDPGHAGPSPETDHLPRTT